MQATFKQSDKRFWANVRTIGQTLGYTTQSQVRAYTFDDFKNAMEKSGLGTGHLTATDMQPNWQETFNPTLLIVQMCLTPMLSRN